MPIGVKLSPHTFKPPLGTFLNWANTLTRQLRYAYIFNENGGLSAANLVTMRNATLTGSSIPTWADSQRGKTILVPNGGRVAPGEVYNPAGSFTVHISTERETIFTNNHFVSTVDTSSVNAGWRLWVDDTGTGSKAKLWLGCNATTPEVSTVSALDVNRKVYVITGVYDKTANLIKIYFNGKYEAQVSTAGSSLSTSTKNLMLFDDANSPGGISVARGHHHHVFIWDRALNDQEIQQMFYSPYAIIQPERHYFIYASGTLYTQTLTENQSFSDTLSKLVGKLFTENNLMGDSLLKQTSKPLTENQSFSDTLAAIRTFLKTLTESFTNTDTLVKTAQKVFSESQSYVDSLIKSVAKIFTENQTITDTLTKIKVILKTLTESFSSTDTLVKQANKVLSDSQTYVDSVIRSISKTFAENQTIADTLTKIKAILKTLTENISLTDTLTKVSSKVLTEAQSIADYLLKRISKTFTENNSFTDFVTTVLNPVVTGITNVKNYILKRMFKESYTIKNSKKDNTIKLSK